MKFNAFALALATVGAVSAQSVRFLSPTNGDTIQAGKPFTTSVIFADTTSSVDVVALSFGLRASNDPEADDIGQTVLGTVHSPNFVSGEDGFFVNTTTLTIPTNLITGLNQNYSFNVAEFFLLGAENTPLTLTNTVTIFVSSD